MKSLIIISLLCFTPIVYAVDTFEIEHAQRLCQIQKDSLPQIKKRNGTPACDELKRLQKQAQKERRQVRQARQTNTGGSSKKSQSKIDPVSDGKGAGYRWNSHQKRYCQHNPQGIPLQCY